MYKYQKILKELEENIYNGYDPGDKFPAEEKLRARFGVNRATIHKVIEELGDRKSVV